MAYIEPNSVNYFFGRMLREECERILNQNGLKNGLYLLREQSEEAGSYALSLCFQNEVHHYRIERQEDDTVKIDKGKRFIGPVELVKYHQIEIDGLVTKLTLPCNRPLDIPPLRYLFVDNALFNNLVEHEIQKNCKNSTQLNDARGRYRYKYERTILKDIHLKQPWFKENIDREEAVKILQQSGFKNGKFLVRCNRNFLGRYSDYKISICYNNDVKHYKINCRNGKFALDGGKEFGTIIQLVDYYHRCPDCLVEKLLFPYIPGSEDTENIYDSNVVYEKLKNNEAISSKKYVDDEPVNQNDITDLKNVPNAKRALFEKDDNYIYDTLPNFSINENDLVSLDVLGAGNYATVCRGLYRKCDRYGKFVEIPVAIKKLKSLNDTAKLELVKEAETMQMLHHPHIVKFIGICTAGTYTMVLELSKLGPIHKYLQKHKESMAMSKIIKLMFQVASAMEYLASKNIVHRDLAARNVLLSSEDNAKVSDFGMSRILNEDHYYCSQGGSWPYKWYPPEALKTWKFDEKSDVWSFAVLCWETTSYGDKPYLGIKINPDLIKKLENGHRLDKPINCPQEMYNLMTKCWEADKHKRPKFSQIVKEIEIILSCLYNL